LQTLAATVARWNPYALAARMPANLPTTPLAAPGAQTRAQQANTPSTPGLAPEGLLGARTKFHSS